MRAITKSSRFQLIFPIWAKIIFKPEERILVKKIPEGKREREREEEETQNTQRLLFNYLPGGQVNIRYPAPG